MRQSNKCGSVRNDEIFNLHLGSGVGPFLIINTREWDLTIRLVIYIYDLVLASVETCLPEVYAYVCLKGVTAGVWEGRFDQIWVKILLFLKIKTDEWNLTIFLFEYWNSLAIDTVQTYLMQFGAYMSLERATTCLWQGCFSWIWLKIWFFFLNIKTEDWNLQILLFNPEMILS